MKTIRKNTIALSLFLSLLGFAAFAQGYGEIRGIIKDVDLSAIPFATIKVLQGNQLVGGTQSDAEGRYHYKPLNPGVYEIVVMESGHQTQPVNKIIIKPNEATYVDVKMQPNMLGVVDVYAPAVDYSQSGVSTDMFSMVSIDSKDLRVNASWVSGDVKNVLETLVSDVVNTGDGEIHFRGSRGDANGYFVDGVRTLKSTTVPGLSIDNLTVFSGGVPASYGDVTSGVVIITTKSYFSGLRDKNMRVNEQRERMREEKAEKQAKEDELNRQKEIEAEKAKEKMENEKAGKS